MDDAQGVYDYFRKNESANMAHATGMSWQEEAAAKRAIEDREKAGLEQSRRNVEAMFGVNSSSFPYASAAAAPSYSSPSESYFSSSSSKSYPSSPSSSSYHWPGFDFPDLAKPKPKQPKPVVEEEGGDILRIIFLSAMGLPLAWFIRDEVIAGAVGCLAGAIIGNRIPAHISKNSPIVGTIAGGIAGAGLAAWMEYQQIIPSGIISQQTWNYHDALACSAAGLVGLGNLIGDHLDRGISKKSLFKNAAILAVTAVGLYTLDVAVAKIAEINSESASDTATSNSRAASSGDENYQTLYVNGSNVRVHSAYDLSIVIDHYECGQPVRVTDYSKQPGFTMIVDNDDHPALISSDYLKSSALLTCKYG